MSHLTGPPGALPPPPPPPPSPVTPQAEPAAPQAQIAAVPIAPAQDLLVPSGTPYRVPAPNADLVVPETYSLQAPKRPRPILGPSLSVFAATLWTFVVAGQFTTSWSMGAPLGEKTAAFLVLLTTFVAFIASVRMSRLIVPPRTGAHLFGRALAIGVLAFVSFFFTIVAATAAGGVSSHNHDFLIAFVLVVVSFFAALGGPRLTSRTPMERTHRHKVARTIVWVAGAILTLVAAVDLGVNG